MSMLEMDTYLVKEQVGLLKMTDTYDIFDPETNEQVGVAREEPPGWAQALRFLVSKKLLPTQINIYEQGQSRPLFSIKRGVTLFRSRVDIHDGKDRLIGYFKSKLLSIGGGFYVYDHKDNQFAEVKGDWKGWNFKFVTTDGEEMGTVAKKWAGLAKELFTSADNYVIALTPGGDRAEDDSMLLLAAGLAIDIIYKEGDR